MRLVARVEVWIALINSPDGGVDFVASPHKVELLPFEAARHYHLEAGQPFEFINAGVDDDDPYAIVMATYSHLFKLETMPID